ncbi:MAG: hypothetical protein P4L81_01240 [Candidatus Pacebacteria bacterium]|nr:hypothetical protein [Candidatus Paceibacterota bacterium]
MINATEPTQASNSDNRFFLAVRGGAVIEGTRHSEAEVRKVVDTLTHSGKDSHYLYHDRQ